MLVNLRLAWRLLPWTFLRRLVVPLTINLSYTTSLLGRGIITEQVGGCRFAWQRPVCSTCTAHSTLFPSEELLMLPNCKCIPPQLAPLLLLHQDVCDVVRHL